MVETTNATLGGPLETADIADLPLNGRVTKSVGLRPGVMLQPGGGPWTQSTKASARRVVWLVEASSI